MATVLRRGDRGLVVQGQTRQGVITDTVPLQEVSESDFSGSRIEHPHLVGQLSRTRLVDATLTEASSDPGAVAWSCQADRLVLVAPALAGLELNSCRLRQAQVAGGVLGILRDCDLRDASLRAVDCAAILGCDLSGSRIQGCDWSDADLRGTSFRDVTLEDVELIGARVEGADFRGVRGLSPAARRALVRGGALLTSPGWTRVLRRWFPDPNSAQRMARVASVGVPVVVIPLLALAGVAALRPPEAPRLQTAVRLTQVSQQDRLRTKEALASLRSGLAAAHADIASHGGMRWPTLGEVQDNAYDVDGDGPATETRPIVAGGFPRNHLTASEGGVLPYCNQVPDQNTLTGVDTDWHYCPETGRVFASAGFTSEPTLDW